MGKIRNIFKPWRTKHYAIARKWNINNIRVAENQIIIVVFHEREKQSSSRNVEERLAGLTVLSSHQSVLYACLERYFGVLFLFR